MSKEKEEKKKIRISSLVGREFLALSESVSEVVRQYQSVSEAIKPYVDDIKSTSAAVADILKPFYQVDGVLQQLSALSEIAEEHRQVMIAFGSSSGLKALHEYQSQINQLAGNLVAINKDILELGKPVPTVIPELTAIQPKTDTLVRSLVEKIDFLEKELSKEKEKNRELIALLKAKRKELKEKYVA